MRWRSVFALALAAGVAAPQAQGQDTRPGVAVFPFDNGGSYGQAKENFDALQVGLAAMMITDLANNPQVRVVERGRINDLLAEQKLGASGQVDAQTAARLGKIVGAKYVILGSFIDWYGNPFTINARIVNVETTEIIKAEKVEGKREQLFSLLSELGTKVMRGANLPALPRQAMETRQSRPQVPTEALTYYSRAILYQDRGDKAKAVDLFNRAIATFPQYTEAKQALQQLNQSE
jgi:TolB-like protein